VRRTVGVLRHGASAGRLVVAGGAACHQHLGERLGGLGDAAGGAHRWYSRRGCASQLRSAARALLRPHLHCPVGIEKADSPSPRARSPQQPPKSVAASEPVCHQIPLHLDPVQETQQWPSGEVPWRLGGPSTGIVLVVGQRSPVAAGGVGVLVCSAAGGSCRRPLALWSAAGGLCVLVVSRRPQSCCGSSQYASPGCIPSSTVRPQWYETLAKLCLSISQPMFITCICSNSARSRCNTFRNFFHRIPCQ
jgi:hypothetical protein